MSLIPIRPFHQLEEKTEKSRYVAFVASKRLELLFLVS